MSLVHIKQCQSHIRDLIKEDIEQNDNFRSVFSSPVCMKKIAQYALNSGKRLRPMIIWSMSSGENAGRHFSLFIEYIHNSSLIINDLSCNNIERRGIPSVHAKYGECIAQLVAWNLMITAMKHLSDGFRETRTQGFDQISDAVNAEISHGLGYQGICGGQFLDSQSASAAGHELRNISKRQQRDLIIEIARLKTGCLFGLSFILGWITMRRGEDKPIDHLDQVKEAGYGFGICYKIINDLRGVKNEPCPASICKYFTRNEIIDMFTDNIERFAMIMTQNDIWNNTIRELYNYLLQSFRTEIKKYVAFPS
jgi:geranylgeranyl pyrophosphate synthase